MLRGKTFKCKAYAKINLFLNVFDKTKDKLHNLKSLVCFIDLYDEIIISESKKFSIIVKGPFKNFIKKRENIIEKTFIIFSKFTGLKTNYKILLNKKIPVSAGLGGGSADAAAVLQGLNLLNNSTNNSGRANYNGNLQSLSKFKYSKIDNFNELEPEIIFEGKNIIFFDNKGSILKFDQFSKLIWKKNYYKKTEKKQKPILSLANNQKTLDNIVSSGKIDENTEKDLKKALENYSGTFNK